MSTSRRTRRPRAVLGAAAFAGAALVAGLANAAGDDPVQEPVPEVQLVDDARSFVAAVDFTSLTAGTSGGATVAAVATPGTSHLASDLVVRSEADGRLVSSFTLPHPASSFADGVGYFFEAGRYDLLAPFDASVDTLRLTTPAGATVATVDTAAAVRQFCVDNPQDPACLEADLSVDSVALTGPAFVVPGRAGVVTGTSVFSNIGPDGPVDARVTRRVTVGAGLTVLPASDLMTTSSLAVGASVTMTDSFAVTCSTPGRHPLALTTSVTPRLGRVVDPQPANDTRTATFTLDCPVPVAINVQPGSRTNPVNLTGSTTPVAVLTTSAGEYSLPQAFDARAIDAASVRFGSQSALLAGTAVPELHTAIHPADSYELNELTRDGDLDAVVHFGPRKTAFVSTDTRGCVLGRTTTTAGGLSFYGCDTVLVKR